MQTPLVCWGRFRPLVAVALLVLTALLVLDALLNLLLADHPELLPPNVNWIAIDENVGGRLAELARVEADGQLDPERLVLLIGQSSVREAFEPTVLADNDPLAQRWVVLGASGLDMRDLEATCLPLANSNVKAKTVVVGLNPWMVGEGAAANTHYPAASAAKIAGDVRHLRLRETVSDLASQSTLVRCRTQLGFLRKMEMFRIRLALSRYLRWPFAGTFEPRDPWPSPAENETIDEPTQFARYIEFADQFRQEHFENCLPQAKVLRGTIQSLRARGYSVVIVLMPERSLLRNLLIPEAEIELGRVLSDIGGDSPLPILDFRRALPDSQFNTNAHVDAEGRNTISRLLPAALAAIDGESAAGADPANFAPPQFRVTAPLPSQVVQQSSGETAVAVRGQSVGPLAGAQVCWRRDGDGDFSAWQDLDVTDRRDCRGRVMLPRSGWYDLKIRAFRTADGSEMTDQVRFGVGEVFVVAGGGRAANLGGSRHQATADVVAWRGGTWAVANDPQLMASGTAGSPWPMFGEQIVPLAQAPVGIISVAQAGTNVSDWGPGTPLFDRLRRALAATGDACARAILWDLDVQDSPGAQPTADVAARLDAIVASLAAKTGCAPPCLVLGSGRKAGDGEGEATHQGTHLIVLHPAEESTTADADSDAARAAAWVQAIDASQILPRATP